MEEITKKLFLGLITCSLIAAFATISFASWDTCIIQRLGVTGSDTTVFKVGTCEDDSSNNGKWLAITQQKDRSLATLLTGVSLTKSLKINADFAAATTNGSVYGNVTTLYLDQ